MRQSYKAARIVKPWCAGIASELQLPDESLEAVERIQEGQARPGDTRFLAEKLGR
jgi:hypothetical protein